MNHGILILSEDDRLFTENMVLQKVEHRVPDMPQFLTTTPYVRLKSDV